MDDQFPDVYDDILIPTDGSDASMAAVEQVEIAAQFDAAVYFPYVVDFGTEISSSAVGNIADELSKTFEKTATDALYAAEQQANEAGVDAIRTTLEGFPHKAIVEYSNEHDIDCIVMGSTGRSGLSEQLLGSTTE